MSSGTSLSSLALFVASIDVLYSLFVVVFVVVFVILEGFVVFVGVYVEVFVVFVFMVGVLVSPL